MAALGQLRKELKEWEADFLLKFNRKPQKQDLENAPKEIADKYRHYRELRKTEENASTDHALPFVEYEKSLVSRVWGKELNKVRSCEVKTEPCQSVKIKSPSTMSLSKKILQNPALMKNSFTVGSKHSVPVLSQRLSSPLNKDTVTRNSMNVSLNSMKNVSGIHKDSFHSDSSLIVTDSSNMISSSIFDRALKFVSNKKQEVVRPSYNGEFGSTLLLLPQTNGVQRKTFLSTISLRQTEQKQSEVFSCNESGTGATAGSQVAPAAGIMAKQSQNQNLAFESGENELGSRVLLPYLHGEDLLDSTGSESCVGRIKRNIRPSTNHPTEEQLGINARCGVFESCIENEKTRGKILPLSSSNSATPSGIFFEESNAEGLKPSSKSCLKRSFSKTEAGEDDLEKRKRLRFKESKLNVQDKIPSEQVLETADAVEEVNEVEFKKKCSRTKGAKSRSLGPSRSTGSVSNGNYVRLNMKAKRYKRKGGRPTSGPAAKRLAWKMKMQSRSKGESRNCFRCGQEGHWAKNCKGKGGKLSNTEPEMWTEETAKEINYEEFPTLEEAYYMSQGIRPTVSDHFDSGVYKKSNDEFEEMFCVERASFEPKSSSCSIVQPLYQLLEDGSLPKPPPELTKALKKFGFSGFRPGQETAILRVLCGLSTLLVLSTGAGKSLCYQLSAFMYSQRNHCITLVISPLVSLMQDQVSNLPAGIKGVCLNSNMTASQRSSVLESISSGKIHFLLLSPEMLVGGGGSAGTINLLKDLPPIAFACIDEAHCVSEWSHHFRPSYLTVCKVLRERYGVKCLLGLTATATMATAISISYHLGITDFTNAIIRGAPIPANLKLSVSRDENKEEALLTLLRGQLFSSCQSIIIYCTRREETARVATLIRTCLKDNVPQQTVEVNKNSSKKRKRGGNRKSAFNAEDPLPWNAECYHAGLSAAQRRTIQNSFMSGRLRVVVATVAFGMGLDKSDIRGIIHYNISKTVESYIQEIGRAGRDGNVAYCHLFLDSQGQDSSELQRHIYSRSVDYSSVKKLVQKVFTQCRCHFLHRMTIVSQDKQKTKDEFDYSLLDTPMNLEDKGLKTNSEHLEEPILMIENTRGTVNSDKGSPNICDQVCLSALANDTPDNHVKLHRSENDSSLSASGLAHSVPGVAEKKVVLKFSTDSQQSNRTESLSNGACIKKRTHRICPGHERALPIESLVQELDMKEEGISTLLCYLELHPEKWIYNLQPAYANCVVQCYKGVSQLQTIAKKCPPIAVAVARQKRQRGSSVRRLEFNVIELSDFMGWDSGPVKRELKQLQWESGSSGLQKSGVLVEFTDLAFHFRSPGDLTDDEFDLIINFLVERLETQERTELYNLQNFYEMLQSVSYKSCWSCCDQVDNEKSEKLKDKLQEYLQYSPPLENGQVTALSFTRELNVKGVTELFESKCGYEDQVRADIAAFINLYQPEHALTGRVIARVMHGIDSPCFPATVWGKVRRFWRSHLNVNFNLLRRLATQELIKTRRRL